MLVMGVDENGLGPRLGPLVATSMVIRTPRYRRAPLCSRGLALGLTDSKETGGFGRMSFTESVALGLLQRTGGLPRTADELLQRVWPGATTELRACCPDEGTAAQCWGVDLRLPAFGGDPAEGEALLARLVGRSELALVDVRSRVACAGILNARHSDGTNKLEVDLHFFEDLIASVHAERDEPLHVICGMIGGIRDYAPRFHRFAPAATRALVGRRGQRRYAVDGVGEIRFEVDADARHLPVALASIVGKYVREVSMQRIGEFYRQSIPELRLASGYHDPVTSRFIEQTKRSRQQLRIAPDCFRRHA